MKKRRSRLELNIEVLKVIMDGSKKPTKIMNSVGHTWDSFQTILNGLRFRGFIDEIDVSGSRDKRSSNEYQITRKGNNVIKYYAVARDLIKIDSLAENLSNARTLR